LILAVLLLGALVLSPNRGVPGAGQFEIVGRKAPDFALSGTKGIWRLRDHLGTPLIISFWTTWCPVSFPVLHDPGEHVTRAYERLDHTRYPFTVFVDNSGRVRCVWAYAFRDVDQLLEILARCGLDKGA